MPGFTRKLTAAAIATSILAGSTSRIAAAPRTARARAAATTAASPWIALSAMTSSSSATTTAAAQDYDDGPGFPPIAPLVVILATIALGVYILTKNDADDDLGIRVSP